MRAVPRRPPAGPPSRPRSRHHHLACPDSLRLEGAREPLPLAAANPPLVRARRAVEAWNQESLFKKLSDVPMQFEADPTQHTLATTKEWEKTNPKRGGAAFAVLEYER